MLSCSLPDLGRWISQRRDEGKYQVLVSPNPMAETASLEVKGLLNDIPLHLQVFDLQGNIVIDKVSNSPVFTLRKTGLSAGMYLFKIDQQGALVGNGKLLVKD